MTVDLVALLGEAQVEVESNHFTVGTSGAEPELLGGWSFPERNAGDDRSYRWGLRPSTEFAFTIVTPRDLILRLEGLPAPDSRAPGRFEVRVNATPIEALEVRAGWSQYTVPISSAVQRVGSNRLTLVYDPDRSAVKPSSVGKRPNLAMAWSRIAIDGLENPGSKPMAVGEDTMVLPFGTQAEFLLRAGAGARLVFDQTRVLGFRDGTLEIYQQSDGAPRKHLGSVGEATGVRLDLAETDEPIRLGLVATPAPGGFSLGEAPEPESAGDREGIALRKPLVVSRQRAPEIAQHGRSVPARPNIIIYLVDTLRSDRLGCYGHNLDVSPNLDRFASRASLFENARAQSSWTLASVASIFTGFWPPAHGVVHTNTSLSPQATTLAEILHDAGYLTSAIVTNEFVTAKFGLEQGFEEHKTMDRSALSSEAVLAETIAWLGNRDRSRPFLLYLHTVDPHQPYLPEEEFRLRFAPEAGEVFEAIRAQPQRQKWDPTRSMRRQLLALYDASIAQNDASFGRTIEALESEGLFHDSLVVFTSDHGEEFYEHHSWTHGANLFNETINVPLVIKLPGQTVGNRIEQVAQQVDLLPTLLDYLDLDAAGLPGRSLLGDIRDSSREGNSPPAFSHTFRNKKENFAAIDGDWKLMTREVPDDSWEMLVNWKNDPGEQNNLTENHPIRAEFMRSLVRAQRSKDGLAAAGEAALDDETRAALRALGYLD